MIRRCPGRCSMRPIAANHQAVKARLLRLFFPSGKGSSLHRHHAFSPSMWSRNSATRRPSGASRRTTSRMRRYATSHCSGSSSRYSSRRSSSSNSGQTRRTRPPAGASALSHGKYPPITRLSQNFATADELPHAAGFTHGTIPAARSSAARVNQSASRSPYPLRFLTGMASAGRRVAASALANIRSSLRGVSGTIDGYSLQHQVRHLKAADSPCRTSGRRCRRIAWPRTSRHLWPAVRGPWVAQGACGSVRSFS